MVAVAKEAAEEVEEEQPMNWMMVKLMVKEVAISLEISIAYSPTIGAIFAVPASTSRYFRSAFS